MAGRERVLVLTALPTAEDRLAAVVAELRRRGAWPFVLALTDPADEAALFRERMAGLGAQSFVLQDSSAPVAFDAVLAAVGESEADAIVLVDEAGPLATFAEHAARRAAAEWDIPLWAPATGAPSRADRTIGAYRFVGIPLPRPQAARDSSYWFATIGTGLLAIVATAAGTFSYLSAPPVGFVLSAIAVVGILIGSRLLHARRGPSTVAAIATFVTLGLLAIDPFGGAVGAGSVLVPDAPMGWAWIAVVGLASFAVLVVPNFRALREGRMVGGEGVSP